MPLPPPPGRVVLVAACGGIARRSRRTNAPPPRCVVVVAADAVQAPLPWPFRRVAVGLLADGGRTVKMPAVADTDAGFELIAPEFEQITITGPCLGLEVWRTDTVSPDDSYTDILRAWATDPENPSSPNYAGG